MGCWVVLAMALVTAVIVVVTAVRHRFVVVTVSGASMAPALRPGDQVLVRRGAGDRVQTGAVVVLRQPDVVCPTRPASPRAGRRSRDRWAIKRVAATGGDAVPDSVRPAVGAVTVVPPGKLVVLGDNAAGTDSRIWGFCATSEVFGAVVGHLSRPVAGH